MQGRFHNRKSASGINNRQIIRCRLPSILSRGASARCPLFLKGSKSAVHAHHTPTPWAGLSARGSPAGRPHGRCQVNSYHSYLASDISVTSTTDLPHGPHPTSSQGPAEAVTAPPHGHTSRGSPWPPRCTATSAGEQALPSGWPGPCPPVSPNVCPSPRRSSLFSVEPACWFPAPSICGKAGADSDLQQSHLWGPSAPVCTGGPRPWMSTGPHPPSSLGFGTGEGHSRTGTCTQAWWPTACEGCALRPGSRPPLGPGAEEGAC